VLLLYASLLALPLPSRLNLLHQFEPSRGLFDPAVTGISLVIVIAGLVVITLATLRRPILLFCWLWVVGHLALESSVIGLEMAYEHRLYLPMFGVSLGIAFLWLHKAPLSLETRMGFAILVVTLLGLGTFCRNITWGDPISLWSDVVAKSPQSSRAHINLGRAYSKERRMNEAIAHLDEALRLAPRSVEAHFNLGQIAASLGRRDEAVERYEAALRIHPDYTPAQKNLGVMLLLLGRPHEAIAHFRESLLREPADVDTHFNAAVAFEQVGRLQNAMAHYRWVRTHAPNDLEAGRRIAALRGRIEREETARDRYPVDASPE
jgi:Tfp pilus assembly protein PilF